MDLEPYMGPCGKTTACFCDDNMVRDGNGQCIKRKKCPKKEKCGCPKNEHLEKDSNRCQITCENMDLEPYMGPCGKTTACFCDDDMVRDENGHCVKRKKCE